MVRLKFQTTKPASARLNITKVKWSKKADGAENKANAKKINELESIVNNKQKKHQQKKQQPPPRLIEMKLKKDEFLE